MTPRPKASGRQVAALLLAPAAGLGALRALGASLDLVVPGASRLMTVIAMASYLLILTLAGALLGAFIAPWAAPDVDGLVVLLVGLVLSLLVFTARGLVVVRLFRVIMAQPLVAALLKSALASDTEVPDQAASTDPA